MTQIYAGQALLAGGWRADVRLTLEGERIVEIGKEITDYNAIDTGLFACGAALVACLQLQPCTAFEPLRADAAPPEQAYADYLAGRATAAQAALLPEAQRAAAASPQSIAGIADPLARLVAAGAAVRAGRATPEVMALATDTASAQGWRRPLMAWLLLRAERAGAAGDTALEAALRRRVAVVDSGGAPARHRHLIRSSVRP